MTKELKEWLYTPCAVSDLLQLEKDVAYMPIGIVKQKIQYMEDNFGVLYLENNFNHFLFNQQNKESLASGSIGITMMQGNVVVSQLIGAATFPLSFYGTNTHYAATLESLCIVNAFGGKYPQFGSGLNKLDVVAPSKVQILNAVNNIDAVTQKLFDSTKKKVSKFKNREEALAYLSTTEYNNNLELKSIANNLPL